MTRKKKKLQQGFIKITEKNQIDTALSYCEGFPGGGHISVD